MEQNVVLEMRDISKNFTGVRALSHVDFTLRKGEIHALMGENGAGKSTLIKVLTGVHEFESGSIHMNGENKDIINHSPQEAQANGISTVYQEVNLCPNLTVAENLFIGREPRNKVGMINWKEMNARSAKLLESLNINVPPTQMLDECSVAIQQMIAIARAVDMKCKVLILDEPTSSLDDEEVEKLFVLMRRLREEGVGIIFVTHFLEQVYAVCDRITVLRNGELVGEYETKDLPRVMLVAKMMGKDFDDLADIKGDHKDKKVFSETPVIEAEGIGHKGTIRPFDLKINKGEVIGLTGLLGSGRSELVRSIYGADKADSGTLKVNGKEVKINSPLDAMKLGMAYLPEDRKAEGIIADLSVRENIIIAMQAKKGMFHPMSRKEMEEAADKYIDMLQIKTASRETPIKSLSGGNQQKVILGRWLLTNPEYLILDEPTRGIDIGTKTEIQKIVLDLADQGMAVTFISSEVEEMLRTCSRMAVLRDGEKVGELEESEPVIDAEGIGHKGTIRPFDLKINKGEVIGLTGLLGSGRSELVRSIYGADKADSGTLKVNGKEVKINSPLDAMKLGMAYLPEDRKAEGIIADLSVRENIIIAMQAKKGMFHPMSRKEMEEAADKYIDMLQIKTASRETPIKSLSGGNQQKVILGRWLLTNPEYLILDEPTRGIDIGTKTEIQKIVLDLADQGMAVTFISSEVEEMLRTCSRMAVLRDGEKVGELEESELSQSNIMKAIAGGDDKNE